MADILQKHIIRVLADGSSRSLKFITDAVAHYIPVNIDRDSDSRHPNDKPIKLSERIALRRLALVFLSLKDAIHRKLVTARGSASSRVYRLTKSAMKSPLSDTPDGVAHPE